MSKLTHALEKFSFWLENSQSIHAQLIRNNPLADDKYQKEWSLQPGLERETVERYIKEINLELPEEIYEIYQWHNGRFQIGDYANPVHFPSFEEAFYFVIKKGFKKFPIFLGEDFHYAIDPVARGQKFAPIQLYRSRHNQRNGNIASVYAPSITNVMKAVAECAEKYDAISLYYADFDSREQHRVRSSLITKIYRKYKIFGASCGLWK